MKRGLFLALLGSFPITVWAIYAPIPQPDPVGDYVVWLDAGVYYDTNVFGADTETGEKESAVFTVSPRILYEGGGGSQTLVTAYYDLDAFIFTDRPSDDSLFNHEGHFRVRHEFSPDAELMVSDTYRILENPESFENGLLQSDQSYDMNIFNVRSKFLVSARVGSVLKYQNINIEYDDSSLSTALDRMENRFGGEIFYLAAPTTKILFEYRYQDIGYDDDGDLKDSNSHFFLGGLDWASGPQSQLSLRAGIEDRDRKGDVDRTSGYVLATYVRRYGTDSFVSVGGGFDVKETTSNSLFFDEDTISFFANIQHAMTAAIYLTASIRYDDITLNTRDADENADIAENVFRFGVNLVYRPDDNWAVILSYDLDDTESDERFRNESRSRVGVSARYSFGP